jgi:hypothetical protein
MRSEARREQPDLLHRRSPDFELKHRQGAISYVSFAAGNSRGPTAAEGRVHHLATGRFRVARFQGPLSGDEPGKQSDWSRP